MCAESLCVLSHCVCRITVCAESLCVLSHYRDFWLIGFRYSRIKIRPSLSRKCYESKRLVAVLRTHDESRHSSGTGKM